MAELDPEAYLDSLEPIGWRLGLERMHKLCAVLGMPQHRFASIHVVGTNGKSSVTRISSSLLEAHGLRSGACVSPHPSRWSERVLLGTEEIGAGAFAAAVARAAEAAQSVNRTLAEGESVTQFEVATAAAFLALASAGVEVAVIEAGLGGRLDATNTIPSSVTTLTSIGLDHTAWLGDTELAIAAEKLAVLRDSSTLVVGHVSPEVAALAERSAARRGARFIRAPEDPGAAVHLLAPGRFQRRNFALAATSVEAFLGRLDQAAVASVAAGLRIPGRLERLGEDPAIFLDVAHNPDGAAALAEALPEVAGGLPIIACLAILEDKDAEAMIAALAPALERVVCTELPPSARSATSEARRRSTPAAALAAACERAGLLAEAQPELGLALARARVLAAGPPPRTLIITGSHYLLGPARATLAQRVCDD